MILVTGATGNVGRHVVSQLLEAGEDFQALTRNPESAGLPDGVTVVRGDLFDPSTLDAILAGVDTVFLVWPGATSEAAPSLITAIAKHARRIVYLSASTVPEDPSEATSSIIRFHAEIEQLIERSGLEWTFLRAGGFATNTLGWAGQIRDEGIVRWPYGAAARSLIHERDIAAVAVRALTEDGHTGAKYVLTGPQTLTQSEQVRIIGEAIGREVRWEDVEPAAAREQMVAMGWPAEAADGALGAWAEMVTHPEPVTSTVPDITGAPAHTFREWATDHAAAFR
jgi:uncharacterized protein YbjT (DUF2867 family)